MSTEALTLASFIAALGSGRIAGTFFAFSAFVTAALARLPAEQGVAAMQSINLVVINPVFLGVFLGTGLLSDVLAVGAGLAWRDASAAWIVAGAVVYLVGCLLVTMVSNVPLNNALSRMTAASPAVAQYWPEYVTRWTTWNHVRTAAALAATSCFMLALR